MKRLLFTLFALLWLPLGIMAASVYRLGFPLPLTPDALPGLVVVAPFGLPLALAWRAQRKAGHPVSAWLTFIVLAPAAVVTSLFAGLLGPLAIAVCAVASSLPAWVVYAVFRHQERKRQA